MTLVVALKSVGGIILAADSRGTIGDPRGLTAINDTQIKIYGFGQCGIALAGAGEMGAVLLDELHKKGLDSFTNIDSAIGALVSELASSFSTWFKDIQPAQRLGVLFTLAGYRDGTPPEPMIYLLNSQTNFAPQLFRDTSLMGVPQYAVYLVHRYYDASITLEKAKALAEYLIDETASQDPKVGGPVRMAVIQHGKPYEELAAAEVDGIHQSNDTLKQRLREFFLA